VITPANGATLVAGARVLFEVMIPEPVPNIEVEVASQDSVGPTGELASTVRLERIEMFKVSLTSPGTYRGTSAVPPLGGWSSAPGTYYWQLRVPYVEVSGGQLHAHEELSPVFSLVIAPLPSTVAPTEGTGAHPGLTAPPTLTLTESYNRVKLLIRTRTGHIAHHLSDHCTRKSGAEVACKATWLSALPRPSNAVRYAGTFVIDARSDGIHSSFAGFGERLGCVRRRGSKRCAFRVHWR
jgi:hypothetical protein